MKVKKTTITSVLLLTGTAALAEVTVRNEVKVKPAAASAESLAATAQGGADARAHPLAAFHKNNYN